MNPNPVKIISEEFWLYFRVGCLTLAFLMFLLNWALKADIAKSFKITGLIAAFVIGCMLLVIGLDNEHAYIFGPLFSLSLAFWWGLENWYFYRYKALQEWIQSPDRRPGTFGLNTWLGRLLSDRDTGEKQIIPSPAPTWRNVSFVLGGLCVFLLLFGFSRSMDKVALLGRVLIQQQVQSKEETKAAIDSSAKRSGEHFSSEISSLSATQQQFATSVTAGTARLDAKLDRNGKKMDKAEAQARKAARLAAAAANRSRSFIIVQPMQPKPPMGYLPTQTVPEKLPPAKTKPNPKQLPQRPGKNQTVEANVVCPDSTKDVLVRNAPWVPEY